jgi:protein TonB
VLVLELYAAFFKPPDYAAPVREEMTFLFEAVPEAVPEESPRPPAQAPAQPAAAALPVAAPAPAEEAAEAPLPEPAPEAPAGSPAPAAQAEPFETPGASGSPVLAGPGNSAPRAPAKRDYLALVLGLLEANKIYPLSARKRGLEGEVALSFVIEEDGKVRTVAASGAHAFLLDAARESVRRASPFPPPEGGGFEARLTIVYRLE